MGSEQRQATLVAIILVLIATLVMVYLFYEPHRLTRAEEDKTVESAERGIGLYIQFCLECHGENGSAAGRRGVPLNLPQNQATDPVIWEQREDVLWRTIERGRGQVMPAWAESEGGPLNQEQIRDLVNLIHLGLWEEVEAATLAQYGGEIPTPPAVAPPDDGPDDPVAARGQEIYLNQGCAGCHSVDGSEGTGPTWLGLWESEVPLEGGETVTADEEYIRESILNPGAKIHEGYPNIMPPYEGVLSDEDIDAIIAYIQTLEE